MTLPKFITLFDVRTGCNVSVNVQYITSIKEASTNWGVGRSDSEVEYIGNAGYHTTRIYCAETRTEVLAMISEGGE